ncbi:hypothetical protein [Streptomyces nigrescens]
MAAEFRNITRPPPGTGRDFLARPAPRHAQRLLSSKLKGTSGEKMMMTS